MSCSMGLFTLSRTREGVRSWHFEVSFLWYVVEDRVEEETTVWFVDVPDLPGPGARIEGDYFDNWRLIPL